MKTVKQERADAYDAGWADAVRLYAIWGNGVQWVGVTEEPLEKVLEEGPPNESKLIALYALEEVSNAEA